MREEKELQLIADTFTTWLLKIKTRKAVGMNDISFVSEDLAMRLLNLVYNLSLENLNLSGSKRADAIDLADDTAGIAFQVTTSSSSVKIRKNLELFNRKNLIQKYPKGIRFLILSPDTIRLGNIHYGKILKGFDRKKHILTYRDLLKKVRAIYSSDKERFNQIRDMLNSELNEEISDDLTGLTTWDISGVVAHGPMTIEAKMKLLKDNREYEESIKSYFQNPMQVIIDFENETNKIIPALEKIIAEFHKSKIYFYRESNPSHYILGIEHETTFAIYFQWSDLDILHFHQTHIADLTLTCALFKAKGFDRHQTVNKNFTFENQMQDEYVFHLAKSNKIGWKEVGGENFHSTEELIIMWHNQLLNKLVF